MNSWRFASTFEINQIWKVHVELIVILPRWIDEVILLIEFIKIFPDYLVCAK